MNPILIHDNNGNNDVTTVLVSGKIFHFWACKTGAIGGLGETLVRNGATAFIGYNQLIDIDFRGSEEQQKMQFEPDCVIVNSIIDSNINRNDEWNGYIDAVRVGQTAFLRLAISAFISGSSTIAGNAMWNLSALRYVDEETLNIQDGNQT